MRPVPFQRGSGLFALSEPPSTARPLGDDRIHALRIETDSVADLSFSTEEELRWLCRSAIAGGSLVVVVTPGVLELYSTHHSRHRAFRAVMEWLAERVSGLDRLANAQVSEVSDTSAATHLLRRVAGLAGGEAPGVDLLEVVHGAGARSMSAGALGPLLGSLLWAAASVGRRVRVETELGNPGAGPESADLARLAAERIVEEELAGWRCRSAEAAQAGRSVSSVPPKSQGGSAPESSTPTRPRAPGPKVA